MARGCRHGAPRGPGRRGRWCGAARVTGRAREPWGGHAARHGLRAWRPCWTGAPPDVPSLTLCRPDGRRGRQAVTTVYCAGQRWCHECAPLTSRASCPIAGGALLAGCGIFLLPPRANASPGNLSLAAAARRGSRDPAQCASPHQPLGCRMGGAFGVLLPVPIAEWRCGVCATARAHSDGLGRVEAVSRHLPLPCRCGVLGFLLHRASRAMSA